MWPLGKNAKTTLLIYIGFPDIPRNLHAACLVVLENLGLKAVCVLDTGVYEQSEEQWRKREAKNELWRKCEIMQGESVGRDIGWAIVHD